MALPIEIWTIITQFLQFDDQLKMRCLCRDMDYRLIDNKKIIHIIKIFSQNMTALLGIKELNIIDLYLFDYTNGLLSDIFNMIDDCIIMELLLKLLIVDRELLQRKLFTRKDKKAIRNNLKINEHFGRTNACCRRYNSKLNIVFNTQRWFMTVRDILMAKQFIAITEEMEEEILDCIEFGTDITSNYCEIKKEIYNSKRVYFGQYDRIKY